jgi:AraC-like DNA-binding protein/TolB-like protein
MTELTNDQIFIRKLTDVVLANLNNENFNVTLLAREFNMSHYALSRRLYSITGKRVNQFIREARLKRALEILQSEDITASEVAYNLGFSSPSYFNKCFSEYFGYPPGKVIKTESVSIGDGRGIIKQPDAGKTGKKFGKHLLPFPLLTLVFLFIIGFLLFKKTKSASDYEDGKISIAVLPFQNRTNDTTWNVWSEGIQECLISWLSSSQELKVMRKEAIYALFKTQNISEYASVTPANAEALSKKLDAGMFIYGSIIKAGTNILFHTELIRSNTKEVLKSFEITAPSGNLDFEIINSLRKMVTDYLLVSKLISENPWLEHYPVVSTNSPEALRYYIYGYRAYY